MTKPKTHKPKRAPKREKPEEHPKHEPVTLEEFEKFLGKIVRVKPPAKK